MAAFGTRYWTRSPHTWLNVAKQQHFNADRPARVSLAPERCNEFGFSDMIGNVWEWVTAQRAPSLTDNGERSAVRGGSFLDDLWVIEPAISGGVPAGMRHSDLGMRVCIVADAADFRGHKLELSGALLEMERWPYYDDYWDERYRGKLGL
jgi:formylglycine-generating enzyme required for sulfatase activity